MSTLEVDAIKDKTGTKTLAALTSSSVTLDSGVVFPSGHVIKTTVVTTTGSISSSATAYAAIENFSYTGTAGNLLFLIATIQHSSRAAHSWYNIYYDTADPDGAVGNVHWYEDSTNGHLPVGGNIVNITGVVTCLSGANSFYLRGGTTSSPAVTLGGGQKYTILEIQQ